MHNALYGEIKSSELRTVNKSEVQIFNEHKHLLDHILEQLDSHAELSVTSPYDEARGKYSFNTEAVCEYEEFIDAITAFYTHLYRYTNKVQGKIDKNQLGAEALHVLKETFKGENGYKEALVEVKYRNHGGLGYIFNKITEYLKNQAWEKHSLKTFKENIDPFDFRVKVNLIKEILNRSKDHLPEEILSQPPERFAENPEEIIKAFIQIRKVLETALRRL
jgi:hypothetical protein